MGLEKWGRCEKLAVGKIRKGFVIHSKAISLPMLIMTLPYVKTDSVLRESCGSGEHAAENLRLRQPTSKKFGSARRLDQVTTKVICLPHSPGH